MNNIWKAIGLALDDETWALGPLEDSVVFPETTPPLSKAVPDSGKYIQLQRCLMEKGIYATRLELWEIHRVFAEDPNPPEGASAWPYPTKEAGLEAIRASMDPLRPQLDALGEDQRNMVLSITGLAVIDHFFTLGCSQQPTVEALGAFLREEAEATVADGTGSYTICSPTFSELTDDACSYLWELLVPKSEEDAAAFVQAVGGFHDMAWVHPLAPVKKEMRKFIGEIACLAGCTIPKSGVGGAGGGSGSSDVGDSWQFLPAVVSLEDCAALLSQSQADRLSPLTQRELELMRKRFVFLLERVMGKLNAPSLMVHPDGVNPSVRDSADGTVAEDHRPHLAKHLGLADADRVEPLKPGVREVSELDLAEERQPSPTKRP